MADTTTTPRRRRIAGYGWKPDTPDARDRRFAVRALAPTDLPPMVNLRDAQPPVYDQGQIGSCVGQSTAGAIQHLRRVLGCVDDFTPSRLFIYYQARAIEGSVAEDAGCEIRDAIKSIAALGAPPENFWPYAINRFSENPPPEAYEAAKTHLVSSYHRVDNRSLAAIKTPLAMGRTVIFGFSVYSGFEGEEVARTGVLNLPKPEEELLGGHAVFMVGYDDATNRFLVRNSWGEGWGDRGYFTMPYTYATDDDLAADFWTLNIAA
jgi:C1A family cysteine protease